MVIWTKPAKADLKHIHDYIAEDSKHYAKKVVHDIREKAKLLNDQPAAGVMVEEVAKPEIKELYMYSYRIMYELKDRTCYILAVIHMRQNFSAENLP